ncbi:unnamed protein product [Ilex paraguariensis]|uniref:Aluminum-activated malate transporter n=1 Tax=Ilex paraguariensis TaxID=185542 RepID=A0ABC8REJ9_9AQUA
MTVASLVYLLEPLYEGIRQNSIWAVLTVTLIVEFRAGSFATYARFIPSIKRHYDHGIILFLMVGSYHDHNQFHMVTERIYAIAIGCGIGLVISLFILPNWLGEDLQNTIISKFEELAKLVQACVDEYFQELDATDTSKSSTGSSSHNRYEEVLQSNSAEEALATYSCWELRHSRYCYPWKQYEHLGVGLRHLGYTADALHGCLEPHIQVPSSVRALFREPCEHVAEEVVKVLTELAEAIKNHHHCSPHISDHLHEALEELDTLIKTQPQMFLASNPVQKTEAGKPLELLGWQSLSPEQVMNVDGMVTNTTPNKIMNTCLDFSETLAIAAFVSVLLETVARLDLVIEEVEELGKVAHFKEFHEEHMEIVITREDANALKTVNKHGNTGQ